MGGTGPAAKSLSGAAERQARRCGFLNRRASMISEVQVHTIARQMLEKHGFAAIAKAAEQAQACEGRGEADEAKEWRHIEDAMKIIRGPANS
ncbi:hypothetical protein BJS_03804 [Bradyrhizobium japonicum SEMIA 5079]|nr:hypothetical protein BJS_03804 [Bradyrhizobium japonicum SEMIA 5079]